MARLKLFFGNRAAAAGATQALEGAAAAVATAAADLAHDTPLAGAATGEATAAGAATHTVPLAGAPKGVATAAGAISKTDTLTGAAVAGHSVFSRPEADLAAGQFVAAGGGALYAAVDEAVADDADYIYNTNNTFVWARLKLAAIAHPALHDGHRIRARVWKTGVTLPYLFLYLHQGETVIASYIGAVPEETPTDYSFNLTAAEAAAITDYSALEFRLLTTTGTVNIGQLAFEATEPGVVATGALSHSVPIAGAGLTVATADGVMSLSIPLAGTGITTYTRPLTDVLTGVWATSSGTNFSALLDEAVADDTDFVYCSTGADFLGIQLAPFDDPITHTGHKLKIRAWTESGIAAYLNYAVYVSYADYVAEGTPLGTGVHTLTATPTTFSKTISTSFAGFVEDWSTLFVVMNPVGNVDVHVSQVWYEVTQSGTASAAGDLSVTAGGVVDLASAATATAIAQGGLSLSIPLSGSAVAQALAAAGITHGVTLAGAAPGLATATGEISLNVSLSGTAIAEAAAAADISISGEMSGVALSVATATGDMSHGVTLSGSSSAVSTATGNLDLTIRLTTVALAEAVAAAGLTHGVPLSGAALAQAQTSAELAHSIPLTAEALTEALASGNISIQVSLAGVALSQSTAVGGMTHIPLTAELIVSFADVIIVSRENRIIELDEESRTLAVPREIRAMSF